MKFLTACLLFVNLLVFSGCSEKNSSSVTQQPNRESNSTPNLAQPEKPSEMSYDKSARGSTYAGDSKAPASMQPVKAQAPDPSLAKADSAQSATQAIERKIIRNSKLTIETASPTTGQQKITSIAESLGGFVITSDYKQGGANTSETVTITVRVPALQFNEALEKIRQVGDRLVNENVTGQDVTEEFLDLEARIKTKHALEEQFLTIMKQAKNVSDALEVQNEISNVRTEIERMEGRKRYLQNQSELSTITIVLQTSAPIVMASTRGFTQSIKEAFGDGIDLAMNIIVGLIRLVIVLIPLTLFIFLPLGLIVRLMVRRWRANRKAVPVAEAS
ncbi:MAG: DUF4349 domain-containing protein [Acidobacteria bacterium]|nr:DUF4349 domain-containing protein [Acidobacteriota bacterium]